VLDQWGPIADAVRVKDPRPVSLALGVIGLISGIASLITDTPALGLVAGFCAIVAVLAPFFVHASEPEPISADSDSVTGVGAAATGAQLSATGSGALPTRVSHNSLAAATSGASATAEVGLIDPATGLYSEDFFRVAVETRVLAARRHLRPVAVVLFDVIDGVGPGATRQALAEPVAHAIKQTLREADTACRLRDGRYGFVLEDTPEDGAIWTVERLRRKLSEFAPDQTRWAGIACYPAHAFSADEVMAKAEAAFNAAREWAQDRIEVAATE
jgi:GGDEF domain-containing protein